MNFELERRLIEKHFQTQWALSSMASKKVKYQNIPFNQPSNESFVALFIFSGANDQITLGTGPLIRNVGMVDMQVFTPIGEGMKEAREIIDVLDTIYARQTLTEGSVVIEFRDPEIMEKGEQDSWYQINAAYPFRKDVNT